MSNKVAIISPARNEKYLPQTAESCLSNARDEVEFIAVVEDYRDWPAEEWAKLQARYPNLHTIYNSTPKGMRPNINAAAASAISRGAKYLLKLDAHCMVPEGFDVVLKADCDKDWVVVPRRKRLAPETWSLQDVGKPDIDYHYLGFINDPNDFGGGGLNGKVWYERCRERAEIEIDDEMSSQGSGWFMHADYFTRLELMDDQSYGTFWNEFQEIGLKCWLSGGQVKVNKRTWYAHWHKGKAGRGYSLDHKLLRQGRDWTMKWLDNEAWDKQTRPISWLIKHFWPVPTWPENWEEMVYGQAGKGSLVVVPDVSGIGSQFNTDNSSISSLKVITARYGIGGPDDLDVTALLQSKVANNSLDLMVTNSDLEVGNPFRGQKKRLTITYSYNGSEPVTKTVDERDWLIIGQSERWLRPKLDPIAISDLAVNSDEIQHFPGAAGDTVAEAPAGGAGEQSLATVVSVAAIDMTVTSPSALNDLLIRKFSIPSHRLRGPMPIEVPSLHRDDLARLLGELGFNKGAEIGVAEGKYSEVLCKANPNLKLLCVDPWHHYAGNPQGKSKEKNEWAFSESQRRLKGYAVTFDTRLSMEAVRDVPDGSLDFVYIDAHHSYDYFMEDLINWSRKVRVGGIIAGDDAYRLDRNRWGSGPMEGIYDYTRAHGIEPWFLINAHKSVDFFYVKGDWK